MALPEATPAVNYHPYFCPGCFMTSAFCILLHPHGCQFRPPLTTRKQQALRTRSKYFRGSPNISEGIQIFRNIWTGGPYILGVQIFRDSSNLLISTLSLGASSARNAGSRVLPLCIIYSQLILLMNLTNMMPEESVFIIVYTQKKGSFGCCALDRETCQCRAYGHCD